MNALNRRSDAHRFLCLLMAALTVAAPAAAIAQQPTVAGTPKTDLLADAHATPIDAASLLPSAAVAIAVRPAQVLKSPMIEMFPTEVIQAALVKEWGLDPMTAEQVVISAAPPAEGPPHYAVVTTFSKPFEMKPDSEIAEHTAKAQLNGKSYLKSGEPMLPSFYPLTDKVLLAAPEHTLPLLANRSAAGATPPGEFATQFAAAAKGDDLLAMVDVEALRPLIAMGLAQVQGDVPPEAQRFLEAPELVRRVELRLNLSNPAISELIVTANNEADANRLVDLFNEGKQMLMQQIAAETAEGLSSDDPVERAGAQYSQRMMRIWDERLQLAQEGERLVIFRQPGDAQTQTLYMTATIGVLVALLLPAVQAAREAARRVAALNNMKQIMLGLLVHENDKKHFPAQANYDAAGKPLLSWRVHILPYLEQEALYKQFRLDEPWDSEHNKQLIAQMPAIYAEPSSRFDPSEGKTHFLGVAGSGYFFTGTDSPRKIKHFEDGASNTIAVVQVDDEHAVAWTKPQDWTPSEQDPLAGLGGMHAGDIALSAFVDGSVRVISLSIDVQAFKSLLTIAGGEESMLP